MTYIQTSHCGLHLSKVRQLALEGSACLVDVRFVIR